MPPRVTPASSAPTLSGSIAGRVRRRPGCFATTASPTGSGCVQGLDRRGRGRRSDRAPGEYRQGARARARADCTRRRESLRVLPAKRLALPARAVWTAFRPSVSQARDPGRLCRPAAGRAAAAGARGQLGAWPAAHLDRLSDAAHSLGSVPRCLRADRSPPRGGAARGQMRLGVALWGFVDMFEDALKGRSEPRSTPVPAVRWAGARRASWSLSAPCGRAKPKCIQHRVAGAGHSERALRHWRSHRRGA
jgi:hypothetical protein